MRSMVVAKRCLMILAGAGALTLTACGGGGGSSNAAATTSSTSGDTKTPVTPAVVSVQGQRLAAGAGYSLGVTSAGLVRSWGSGMHGTVNTVDTVAAVGTASWGVGLNASWAVTAAGDLLYWGDDAAGKLTAKAVALSGLGHVAAARACGSGSSAMLYVLKTDGSVWGVPAHDLTATSKGVVVTGVSQAKALSDGTDASCSSMLAIDPQGGVWQLQAGQLDAGGIPTQVQGVALTGLKDIEQASCAASSCLAVDQKGQVWAWGKNDRGQLGDGSPDDVATPELINGGSIKDAKVSRVLMTQTGAAYAVTTSGELHGWGQLDGPGKSSLPSDLGTLPARLLSASFAVQSVSTSPVAAAHTLVLAGDGEVFGWGQNGSTEIVSPVGDTPRTGLTDTGIKLN